MNHTLTVSAGARAVRTPMPTRWLALGIGVMVAMAVALSQSGTVGAAGTDGEQTNCIPINYGTCVTPTGFQPTNATTYVQTAPVYAPTSNTGLPGNAIISTYFDPRYCDGSVSIVTDSTGHAINICTSTGQRIYPVFPDYGTYGGYYGGLYNNGVYNNGVYNNGVYNNGVYNNGIYANGFYNNGVYNGVYNNGVYNNGVYANGFYNGVNNYGLTGAPAGYNGAGTYQYTDNRFCGDGQVVFSGGQYFCANGRPLYRSAEVAAPVAAPAPEVAAAPAVTTQATTVDVPAAPVVGSLTTTAVPATVDAPVQASGLGTHVQSVSAPTTPAFAPEPTGHDARD